MIQVQAGQQMLAGATQKASVLTEALFVLRAHERALDGLFHVVMNARCFGCDSGNDFSHADFRST